MPYSPAFAAALEFAAGNVGARAEDLRDLIEFESAWNPRAYNPSGAVGIIQFMPRTLKDLGLLPEALAAKIPTDSTKAVPEGVKQEVKNFFLSQYPSVEAQLGGPVVEYLRRWKPFPTRQSLFMAVFYPAYRYVAPETAFPPLVQRYNPGIDTVSDYLAKVDAKKKTSSRKLWEKALGLLGRQPH